MSWCLQATCSSAQPFCWTTSGSRHNSCINYFCPMAVCTLVHANGSPHGCHLHQPWLQTGTSTLGAPPYMRVAPLYKSAGLPSPWLTFWLNVIQATSRSKTRSLTPTLARLSVHSTHTCQFLISLRLTSIDLLTSLSWWPNTNLSYYSCGEPP